MISKKTIKARFMSDGLTDHQIKKYFDGKCITKFCSNKRKKKGHRYCSKCVTRLYRENNPLKARFYDLRSNAKRRGKDFNIKFKEFKDFCDKNGITGKPTKREKKQLTIDRINPNKGYEINNIKVVTRSYNSRKQWVDFYRMKEGEEYEKWLKEKAKSDKEYKQILEEKQRPKDVDFDSDIPKEIKAPF